tara:strand:- start:221 stop:784 length:564 start_codon:yes stop_codon:yes gene_type:complete
MADDTFDEFKKYSDKLTSLSEDIIKQIYLMGLCYRDGTVSMVPIFKDYKIFVKACENRTFEGIEEGEEKYLVDLESLNSDISRIYILPKGVQYNLTGYYFDRQGKKLIEKKYVTEFDARGGAIGCKVYRYDVEGKLMGQDEEEFGSKDLWSGPSEILNTIERSEKVHASYMRKTNKNQSYAKLMRLH